MIKSCQSCNTKFDGRRDAKTCSTACRKRLQRVKNLILHDAGVIKNEVGQALDTLKGDIIPVKLASAVKAVQQPSEAGFIALGEEKQPLVEHAWQPNYLDLPSAPPFTLPAGQPQINTSPALRSTAVVPEPTSLPVPAPTPTTVAAAPITSPAAAPQPAILSLEDPQIASQTPALLSSLASSPAPAPTPLSQVPAFGSASPITPLLGNEQKQSLKSKLQSRLRNTPAAANFAAIAVLILVSGLFAGAKLTQESAPGATVVNSESSSLVEQGDNILNINLDTVLANGKKLTLGQIVAGPDSTILQVTGDIQSSGTLLASGGGSSLNNAGLRIDNVVVCTAAGCTSTTPAGLTAIPADVTRQGNVFNSASQLVQLTGAGILPTISGANLTDLNATNISSGTLADVRLPGNVTLLGQTIESVEVTDGTIVNADIGASAAIGWTKISVAGSSLADLTTRSASDLSSGTLAVARGGTGASTAQAAINNLSGLTTTGDLLYYDGANSTRIARGANGDCLQSGALSISWVACTGLISLQNAYNNGNTITTTDARDITLTLADTATDSNLTLSTATGSSGFTTISRADGAGAADPAQLLLIDNLDTNRAQPIGLKLQSAAGALTTALDATDAEIVTALAIGSNTITTTTTTIAATELDLLDGHDVALVDTNDAVATAIIGAGALNSGSITSGFGTIDNADTITGTTLNGTTGINTGAGAGTNRIDSSGNLVNIGTVTTSGAINSQTISASANFTGTLAVNGASVTVGTASTTGGTLILQNATNAFITTITAPNTAASSKILTLPNETGTVCTTGSVCSGYQASGSYATTALDNLASVAINTALLPGGDNTIDVGDSTTKSFRTGYFDTSVLSPAVDVISAGILSLGTSTATGVTIGNTANTTAHILQGTAAATYTIGNTNGTGTITLGQSTSGTTQAINISSANGTDSTQTITIGGGTSTTSGGKVVNIANGVPGTSTTNTVAIGSGGTTTGTVGVTIGSVGAAAHTLLLQGGNGASAVSIQAATSGTISLGTTNVNTVTIGSTSNTGTLTLGQATTGETINIGNGNVATGNTNTINIGATATSTGKNVVTIGSTVAASTLTLQGGNTSSAVSIQSAASGTIAIGTANAANTIQIGNTANAIAQTIAIGNNATASSTNTVTIGNLLGTSTTTIQAGTGNLNLTTNSATASIIAKSSTNSTTAFQVQNAASGSLLLVDSTNSGNLTLLGNNGGEIAAVSTDSDTLPAARNSNSVEYYQGYLYSVGGQNPSNTTHDDVYYTKVNADGSVGAWSTESDLLPANRSDVALVAHNGYLYALGGKSAGDNTSTTSIYYAKINADGSTSAWSTSSSTLAAARDATDAFVYNGYVYLIGGGSGNCTAAAASAYSTSYYAKINNDGTFGAWSTTTALPAERCAIQPVVANGYVYVMGGVDDSGTPTQEEVYYAKLNADGTIGSWTSDGDVLPNNLFYGGVSVSNGYIYYMGGWESGGPSTQDEIYYAPLAGDGSVGTWSTSAYLLPAVRDGTQGAVVNGYLYMIGGSTGGTATDTVYYTSTSRVKIGGNLDLVNLAGENLSEGSSGGQLTAGDTKVIGKLNVSGATNLQNSLYVGGNATFGNHVVIQSTTTNQTVLNVLNSSNVSILKVEDLSTNFGAVAQAGAFIDYNEKYEEGFFKNETQATASATGWGDDDEWSVNENGTCVFDNTADTINGVLKLSVTANNSACDAHLSDRDAATASLIFDADNLPVAVFKVRAAVDGAGVPDVDHQFFAGLSDTQGATPLSNAPTNGFYFTNTSDTGGTTGTANWHAKTDSGASAENTACGVAIDEANFALLVIKVISTSLVKFYIDPNVSDGVSLTECGTGNTTNINTAGMAPWFKTDRDVGGGANAATIEIDFFRGWQDDSPASQDTPENSSNNSDNVEQSPGESSLSDALTIDYATSTFDARATLVELAIVSENLQHNASQKLDTGYLVASGGVVAPEITAGKVALNNIEIATAEHIQIEGDVVIHGTLSADKIKAEQIEGMEIITNKISSLQQLVDAQTQSGNDAAQDDPGGEVAAIDLGNLTIKKATISLDLSVNGGLRVGGTTEFHGSSFFYKLVTFVEKTVFKNDVSFEGHLITSGSVPTASLRVAAGIDLANVVIDGNDNSGRLTVAIGENPTAGELLSVNFNKPYERTPNIYLTATNDTAAGMKYYVKSTKDGFSVFAVDAPAGGSTAEFNYLVVQ